MYEDWVEMKSCICIVDIYNTLFYTTNINCRHFLKIAKREYLSSSGTGIACLGLSTFVGILSGCHHTTPTPKIKIDKSPWRIYRFLEHTGAWTIDFFQGIFQGVTPAPAILDRRSEVVLARGLLRCATRRWRAVLVHFCVC